MHKNFLLPIALLLSGCVYSQTPIEDSSFFTPASFYEQLGMQRTQDSKGLKVYSKKIDDQPDAISRTVDIRWVFTNKQDALSYLQKNLSLQSENGYPVKKEIKMPNAEKVYVYREDPSAVRMYEMLGAEQVHWYYIFAIDRVVVKVFTSGNNTSMSRSYAIALAAAKHVSGKLSLPVNGRDVTTFNSLLEPGFIKKINDERMLFHGLAGFEPRPVPEALTDYFDQELHLPGEKFAVRYFVIKNENGDKLDLSDSVAYKKYCYNSKMASLSISLNLMMGSPGDMPKSREIRDREKCRKINNSDYILEYFFAVGPSSELAKGYKYCYMYAMYKQDQPDCYVVFLSDEVDHMSLFPQVYKSSLKYPSL